MKTLLPVFVALALPAAAQEWTRFRGPNGTGVAEKAELPVTWTEKDFRWRTALPGTGHSQPVVAGDRLFVTSAEGNGAERVVLCVDKKEGKILWSRKFASSAHKVHKSNSHASSSPAVDSERVFAVFATPENHWVKAWDHSGKELWSRDLGPFKSEHGHGSSPVVFEDKLIVSNDQIGESSIVALNVKTGAPVWTCKRRGNEKASFSTPCVLVREGKAPELLTLSTSYGISSLDLKTGAINWEARVFDKRTCSSPVVAGDLVIGTCGEGSGANTVQAVKLGGKGDVTGSHLAWTIQKPAPYVPTSVVQGDRLFMIIDQGFAGCVEASTGRMIWRERLGDGFFGSPVLAGGRIYAPNVKGEMVVLAASDEFKILAKNPLGEGSHSTPCIDGNRMYVRTFGHLVCLGAP
jgi:outer membrane protein assembly factor BamB